MSIEKILIKEAIIVEGRDDTCVIKRAVDGLTIETHGFGIQEETWKQIEKAYSQQGIIVFTDPDYAGETIRRRVMARFPEAKQAFLPKEAATKAGDIGIENGSPLAIQKALKAAHFTEYKKNELFTIADLEDNGLAGGIGARAGRERLGGLLGIGYGNSKTFLRKLNRFSITREDFESCLKKVNEKQEGI